MYPRFVVFCPFAHIDRMIAYSFKISFDREVGTNLASEASNEVMKHGA